MPIQNVHLAHHVPMPFASAWVHLTEIDADILPTAEYIREYTVFEPDPVPIFVDHRLASTLALGQKKVRRPHLRSHR